MLGVYDVSLFFLTYNFVMSLNKFFIYSSHVESLILKLLDIKDGQMVKFHTLSKPEIIVS